MSAIEASIGAGSSTPGLGTPVACLGDKNRILIGRDEDNDIQLRDDLLVSGQHAEIIRRGDRTEILDRSGGSGLGVYIGGRRVGRSDLAPDDRFSIGRHDFRFDGECVYQHDDMGAPSLHVDDLDFDALERKRWRWQRKVLLADVSFVLTERTLLGIIGPSGSGKSTLLRAITGIVPATKGTTYYAGRNLYANYSELRTRIGVVPQQDVVHHQLKVRRALRFAAALRLAWDVPRARRRQQVGEIMQRLGIATKAGDRIDTLSGGERKRVSVALELLTKPSLLALDEPTSGLDPHLDIEIMMLLAQAKDQDQGRTVVVVTHTPLHLDLCDHVLVMCSGGRIGYFGPPDKLLGFFQAKDHTEVFRKAAKEGAYWAQQYLGSDIYQEYVSRRMAEWKRSQREEPDAFAAPPPEPADTVAPGAAASGHPDEPSAAPVGVGEVPPTASKKGRARKRARMRGVQGAPLGQRISKPLGAISNFWTLCSRMLAVIAADRGYALLLLLVPPLLALLSHTIPGTKGLSPDQPGFNLEAQRLLIVLIIGAAFMGLTNSIREIIKEEAIYRRERAAGLSPTVYLLSKFAVLAIIDLLQSLVFVYLALFGRGRPAASLVVSGNRGFGPELEIVLAVALVAITSSALGLALGAVIRSPDQATPLLVVAVMTQLVLSGALFEITSGSLLTYVSWIDPSRWGFAAVAATTDLNSAIIHDPLWVHQVRGWWLAMGMLALQALVLLVLARLFLRRYEPGRRRRLV